MTGRNIITPWSFRDGRDYIISFTINGNHVSSALSIKISDKITAEEWTCSYDEKYIECLTQKTGSYKKFETFVSMLKSAILKKSESLGLDLLNLEDLEHLRTQRQHSCMSFGNDNSSTLVPNLPQGEGGDKSSSTFSKKRFLIMTYLSEFDTVRYPIPLNYSGPPDPVVMQNNIKKLRSDLSTLKNANAALEEEVHFLRQGKIPLPSIPSCPSTQSRYPSYAEVNVTQSLKTEQESTEVVNRNSNYNNQISQNEESQIQKLVNKVQKLEDKIFAQGKDHQDRITKLQAENDLMRRKLTECEKYEIELKTEIHQLKTQPLNRSENEYSSRHVQEERNQYPRKTNKNYVNLDGANNRKSKNMAHRRSTVRGRNEYFAEGIKSRYSSTESFHSGSEKDFLKSGYGQRNRDLKQNQKPQSISPSSKTSSRIERKPCSRSRSTSLSRALKFDPTAYILEKKQKQERMAQLRLERVNNHLRERSQSCGAIRSRSNSISESIRTKAPPKRSTGRTSMQSPRRITSADEITHRLSSRSRHYQQQNSLKFNEDHKLLSNYTNRGIRKRQNKQSYSIALNDEPIGSLAKNVSNSKTNRSSKTKLQDDRSLNYSSHKNKPISKRINAENNAFQNAQNLDQIT